MPSIVLDTDQLTVAKQGFVSQLTYGDNFNLNISLQASGVQYSCNASDSVVFVIYAAGRTNPGGSVQNLCLVGAPSFLVNSAGLTYMRVNVSLLTAQVAALVQASGVTSGAFIHIKYTQSNGEAFSMPADTPITIAPDLSAATAGTTAQAPAGYPAPGNLIVYSPLINGDFSVNQRLNTLTTLGSTSVLYGPDKWKIQTSALTGRFTVTQDQQTVVGNLPFASANWTATSSIKIQCTTAQASPAAGDFATLSQFIESALWTPFLNTPFSIAFLYKTNLAATLGVFIQDQALAYNFCIPFALTGDSNWHLATAAILQPPPLATWNINDAANGFSAKVGFCFFCGATLTSAANNAWNTTGGNVGAIGIGNFLSSTSNFLQLTQVAISPGSFAQPWSQIAPPFNYQLCKRYYQKSFPLTVAPGTADNTGPQICGSAATTSLALDNVVFSTPMRSNTTPTLYSPTTGASGKSRDVNAAADITSTASQVNDQGFSGIASGALFTAGHVQAAHWTKDDDY